MKIRSGFVSNSSSSSYVILVNTDKDALCKILKEDEKFSKLFLNKESVKEWIIEEIEDYKKYLEEDKKEKENPNDTFKDLRDVWIIQKQNRISKLESTIEKIDNLNDWEAIVECLNINGIYVDIGWEKVIELGYGVTMDNGFEESSPEIIVNLVNCCKKNSIKTKVNSYGDQ